MRYHRAKAVLCGILDVGSHMNGPPLSSAIECLKLLAQRRLFSESKEQFALVLSGTLATDNNLADDDGNFSNISLIRELSPYDWDVLELLNTGFEASPCNGDLIDAIIVGVDHLIGKSKSLKGKVEKHVIVFSNLEGDCDISKLDEIISSLKKANILLNIIGRRIPFERPRGDSDGDASNEESPSTPYGKTFSEQMRERISAFREILEALEGESFTFVEAGPALALFETRSVAQRAWKVPLKIGEQVSIPVSGYTMVREARPPIMQDVYNPDPAVRIRAVTTYHLNDDAQTPIDVSETVTGYRYGATLVPFSDEDIEKIKDKEEKTLDVIGFTQAENVPQNLYVGNSVLIFVADGDSSSVAVSALAQALFELDAVALVRRIYARGSAPTLGVLTPEIRAAHTGLIYHELAFQQDIRTFTLPSLPVVTNQDSKASKPNADLSTNPIRPSNEQLSAMDKFVSSMMLKDDTDSDGESASEDDHDWDRGLQAGLRPEHVPNPWIQRLYTCVRERGLGAKSIPGSLPSGQGSSDWPLLPIEHLSGLEVAILAVENALSEQESHLQVALREVNQLLPEIHPTSDDNPIVPKRKNDSDEVDRIKMKRRAMASELFGIQMDSPSMQPSSSAIGVNPLSLHTNTVHQVGSVNPVDDFNTMLRNNLHEIASRQLESHIKRLVDDPLTSNILRPKVVQCLRGYRDAASLDLRIAKAYNSFLQDWRSNLEARSSIDSCNNLHNRLDVWLQVIAKDPLLKPISEDEMENVGLSSMDALLLTSAPLKSQTGANSSVDSDFEAPALDAILDDLE